MKIGVCAILKNENLYLREWVEHYINLGFDKIVLYDNNDKNGENPTVVIQDYIDLNLIDIIPYKRNDKKFERIQTDAYNECLKNYKNELDWIAFFDIDEFLCIEKYKNIHHLFNNMKYDKFDEIILSWYTVGGNELYYENKPVQERFTEYIEYYMKWADGSTVNCNNYVKSVIKTSANIEFAPQDMHFAYCKNVCDSECCPTYMPYFSMTVSPITYKEMYLKHYPFKSLSEFLNRKKHQIINNLSYREYYLQQYKEANGWSKEHEQMYQNFLKDNNIEAS